MSKRKNVIWADRKRTPVFGLPWTFTKYELDNDRLFVTRGFLNTREDEVRLYRITDLSMTRNIWQKIIGTGTIHCDSADSSLGDFDIKNIKNPRDIKEQLSELVEKARRDANVYTGENLRGPGMRPGEARPGEMREGGPHGA